MSVQEMGKERFTGRYGLPLVPSTLDRLMQGSNARKDQIERFNKLRALHASSTTNNKDKEPNLSRGAANIVQMLTTATLFNAGIIGGGGVANAESPIMPPLSPKEGSTLVLKSRMPSGIEPLRSRVEASQTITETLSNLLVTREWLEQNPQAIAAVESVTDKDENVIKQYVIAGNPTGYALYETHLDQGKFTKYKAIADIKTFMENPLSLVTSSDGQIIIIGGENPFRSGGVGLAVSYDGGRSFRNIPWPDEYGLSGGTFDLIRINDTTYIGSNGNYEGGVGQFIITLNPESQTTRVQQVNLETIQEVNIDVRSPGNLAITSIDAANHRIKMISNGAFNLMYGFILYDIDYITGEGTIENITKVTMDGVPDYNLGWYLSGGSLYTDAQGHVHYVTSNTTRQLLYDIDLTTRTGTSLNYSTLLDNKGIPNYINGRFHVDALGIAVDTQGKRHTWVAGSFGTTSGSHAHLTHMETRTYYDLGSSSQETFISQQKSMQWRKINGQPAYKLIVDNLGEVFIPIKPDGSPDPDAAIFYTDNGLGNLPVTHRIWLQYIPNLFPGGW